MTIRGSVDVVTTTEVGGWAYAPGRKEPVLVQAVLNHEVLGEAMASIHRPDLQAAGLGDGRSGFIIQLFRPIEPLYMPFLVVKVDGGDVELPRAPVLGFSEFFHSLFVAHPAVGRSRSVFGGLWTDRTDAAALLRGKMAIGQIKPQTAAVITHLIADGFAALELDGASAAPRGQDDLSERVGGVLEEAALLDVLRGVLEDNPLAVQAEWLTPGARALAQPSMGSISTSPAECLEIVVVFEPGVTLDVVRDSHCLPEFTPQGVSRWIGGNGRDAITMAGVNGRLDRYGLAAGTAAVVGPGTLHAATVELGGSAMRVLCLPQRGMPLALGMDVARRGAASRESGVRLVL